MGETEIPALEEALRRRNAYARADAIDLVRTAFGRPKFRFSAGEPRLSLLEPRWLAALRNKTLALDAVHGGLTSTARAGCRSFCGSARRDALWPALCNCM